MPGQNIQKIFKLAQGFRARAKNCQTISRNAVERSMRHAYRNRKFKARNFKSSWISTINAGVRELGTNYSYAMYGLKQQNVGLNKRILAQIAQTEPVTFRAIMTHVWNETEQNSKSVPFPLIEDHQDFGLLCSNIVTEVIPEGKIPKEAKVTRLVTNFY